MILRLKISLAIHLTSELTHCISPFINSLPEKYKQAIIMADIENIPQKEIAERLIFRIQVQNQEYNEGESY